VTQKLKETSHFNRVINNLQRPHELSKEFKIRKEIINQAKSYTPQFANKMTIFA